MSLRTAIAQFLGGLVFLAVPVFVLPFAWADFTLHQAYDNSPACGETPAWSCRALAQVNVTDVYQSTSGSGYDTDVTFSEHGAAAFFGSDVHPAALSIGEQVTVELWHDQVSALFIDGVKHESYAVQPNAWIGVAITVGFGLIGVSLVVAPPVRFILRRF